LVDATFQRNIATRKAVTQPMRVIAEKDPYEALLHKSESQKQISASTPVVGSFWLVHDAFVAGKQPISIVPLILPAEAVCRSHIWPSEHFILTHSEVSMALPFAFIHGFVKGFAPGPQHSKAAQWFNATITTAANRMNFIFELVVDTIFNSVIEMSVIQMLG